MRPLAAALLCLAAACAAPRELTLEPRWHPLEKLVEDPAAPSGTYHTIGAICETGSMAAHLALQVEDQNSVYAHESLHSARQFAFPGGPAAYGARYNADPDFLASEELLGWSAELQYASRHGVTVDVVKVATFMSTAYVQGPGSPNPGRKIFDYDWATTWVKGEIK